MFKKVPAAPNRARRYIASQKLAKANWYLIPSHMHEGVKNYALEGIQPGGFLRAVLENDLFSAASRADAKNIEKLGNWAIFIHCYLPANSYGSQQRVDDWINSFRADYPQDYEDAVDIEWEKST